MSLTRCQPPDIFSAANAITDNCIELYLFLENPHKHFAYKTHIAKELAATLKSESINCVSAESKNLQNRLRFYGIDECPDRVLYEVPLDINSDVTIRYVGQKVAAYNVTKTPI